MAMAMAMVITIVMIKMIDIHNHLIYGVDDGSKDYQMTLKLFEEYRKQNISKIFLTPHVNSSVTRAPREKHKEIFENLKPLAKKYKLEIYLGSEIYVSFRLPEINFDEYVMGNSKVLLLEFSTYHHTEIYDHAYNLIKKGYKVIIAHVERYNYLNDDDLFELKNLGVYLQVNATHILNSKKKKDQKKLKYLIEQNIIDFVATDCHNISSRPPLLLKAYNKLLKLVGENKAQDLVKRNQEKLFFNSI